MLLPRSSDDTWLERLQEYGCDRGRIMVSPQLVLLIENYERWTILLTFVQRLLHWRLDREFEKYLLAIFFQLYGGGPSILIAYRSISSSSSDHRLNLRFLFEVLSCGIIVGCIIIFSCGLSKHDKRIAGPRGVLTSFRGSIFNPSNRSCSGWRDPSCFVISNWRLCHSPGFWIPCSKMFWFSYLELYSGVGGFKSPTRKSGGVLESKLNKVAAEESFDVAWNALFCEKSEFCLKRNDGGVNPSSTSLSLEYGGIPSRDSKSGWNAAILCRGSDALFIKVRGFGAPPPSRISICLNSSLESKVSLHNKDDHGQFLKAVLSATPNLFFSVLVFSLTSFRSSWKIRF